MRPRAYHLVRVADYTIGAVFAASIFVFGLFAFAMGGGLLKTYEMQAIGGVYASFLERVETEAHALRSDYCAGAGADAEGCVAAAQTEAA